jgi:hypothetical protein
MALTPDEFQQMNSIATSGINANAGMSNNPTQPSGIAGILQKIGNFVAPRTMATFGTGGTASKAMAPAPQKKNLGSFLSYLAQNIIPALKTSAPAAGELGLYTAGGPELGAGTEGLTGMAKVGQLAGNAALKYGVPGAVYGATGQASSPAEATANALTTAGISTVAGPALEKVMGTVLGSTKGIYNTIAKWYVGDEAAKDPLITSNLEYGDWQKSRDNLKAAAQKIYQPLQEALSKVNGKVGDFISAVTTGVGKRDINESELIDSIAQRTGGELQDKVTALHSLEKLVGTGSQAPGMAGFKSRTSTMNYQKEIDAIIQDIKNTMVPGDVLNQAKMEIGNLYSSQNFEKGQAPAYSAAKKYIEDMIGDNADTKTINAQYNKLTESSDFIDKNFSQQKQNIPMTRPPNFFQRLTGMITGGAIGGQFGLPQGSPYNLSKGIGGAGLAAIYMALKDAATSTPENAARYASALDKLSPNLNKLLRQFVLNQAQQAMSSQPSASMTGQSGIQQ